MTPGHHKSKVVCECLGVTEAQIVKAIRTCRIRNLKDIIDYTSAGDGCTACHPALREYLKREHPPAPPSNPKDSAAPLAL